jgi:hypothetical protein
MKINLELRELQAIKSRIGATNSQWKLGSSSLNPREQILIALQEGIQIELSEVDVAPGGLLTYKGEQIILYIKDTNKSEEINLEFPEQSTRFHLSDCQTLRDMKRKGRFERYIVTQRQDGKFKVDWKDFDTGAMGEVEAELKVCKNCLTNLNYNNYKDKRTERNTIWTDFAIDGFLRDYSTFFPSKPSRTENTALIDRYVKDWPNISKMTRERRRWTCECCGLTLLRNTSYLHVHHRSGVKTDNADNNLEVLCALCHTKRPYHTHMFIPSKTQNKIMQLRIEQNITSCKCK